MLLPCYANSGLADYTSSQLPTKRLMQQRFLQLIQRGDFLLVVGFEALGFFR
jgi:hypothetical protein